MTCSDEEATQGRIRRLRKVVLKFRLATTDAVELKRNVGGADAMNTSETAFGKRNRAVGDVAGELG